MTTNTERDSVTAEQALEALERHSQNMGVVASANLAVVRAYIESTRAPQPSAADYEAWFRTQQGVAYDGAWAFGRAAWAAAKTAPQPSVSAAEVNSARAGTVVCLEGEGRDVGNVIWAIPKPRPGTAVYLSAQSPTQTAAEGDAEDEAWLLIRQKHEALAGNALAFDPARLPARNEEGCTWHPDLPGGVEIDARWQMAVLGFDAEFVSMEGDDEALYERYGEEGDLSCCKDWEPTSPGAGWLLAAIYDTEDGPFAMFVRRAAQQEGKS